MTVRKRKSKKRSAANSRQLDQPVFFIDEALGGHDIPEALRNAGETVEAHKDIFSSGIPDVEWIEYAGKYNRLVVTKDKRIRYRSAEIQAIKLHKVRIFRFASGNLRGKEMAAILLKAKDKMKKYALKYPGPYIVSISRSGNLNRLEFD